MGPDTEILTEEEDLVIDPFGKKPRVGRIAEITSVYTKKRIIDYQETFKDKHS